MANTLRMQIAEVQIMISQIKKDLDDATTSAQGAAVTAAGGFKAIGANKEEREFALEQAVNDSPTVKKYGRDLMMAESKLARLAAELADQQADEQRGRWAIRARFVDALERINWPAPTTFFSGSEIDKAMDETADVVAEVYASQAARVRRELDAAVNAEVTPRARAAAFTSVTRDTSVERYNQQVSDRARAATYARNLTPDQIDQEADELFGDE